MPKDPKEEARAEVRRARLEFKRNVAAARDAQRDAFRRALEAGLSTREIAEEAELHHTRVGEILRGE
jgi:DNA-directed RNA polymerase specialized sigma24 family protein